MLQQAKALPALALPAAEPVCLRATSLLPLAVVGEGEEAKAERLLYRRYGIYLAVLFAHRAAEEAVRLAGDAASTVFGPARGQGPDLRRGKLSPGKGPHATAAGPAGGVAMGAWLCGGPGAPGLDTRLRLGHLCGARLGL